MKESIRASLIGYITNSLPSRRSQISNWLIKIFGVPKFFLGKFYEFKIIFDSLEPSSRSAFFLGYYEWETTTWCYHFNQKYKPKIIIDLGSNFGYFAFISLRYNPSAKIYCFEPDPFNYKWLVNNINFNKLNNNMIPIELAASNSEGSVSFVPSDPQNNSNLWSKMKLVDKSNSDKVIIVQAITLDKYLKDNKINKVDLVKIDIEGAEGFAIHGMLEGIKNKIYKCILLEVHPFSLPENHEVPKLLTIFKENNYKIFKIKSEKDNSEYDKNQNTYKFLWNKNLIEEFNNFNDYQDWDHFVICSNDFHYEP